MLSLVVFYRSSHIFDVRWASKSDLRMTFKSGILGSTHLLLGLLFNMHIFFGRHSL